MGLIKTETCLEVHEDDNSDANDPQENGNNHEDHQKPEVVEPNSKDDKTKGIFKKILFPNFFVENPIKENSNKSNTMFYLLTLVLSSLVVVCFFRARSKNSRETLLNRDSYAENEPLNQSRESAVQLVL